VAFVHVYMPIVSLREEYGSMSTAKYRLDSKRKCDAGDGLAIESYVKKFRPSQSRIIGAPRASTRAQQLIALFTLRGASSTHLLGRSKSAAHGRHLCWCPGKEPSRGSWRGATYSSIILIRLQLPLSKRVEISWLPWHRPSTNVLSCWIRCSEFFQLHGDASDEPSLMKARPGVLSPCARAYLRRLIQQSSDNAMRRSWPARR